MIEAFLTFLAQEARFHEIPVAVMGDIPQGYEGGLPNLDSIRKRRNVWSHAWCRWYDSMPCSRGLKRRLHSLDHRGLYEPRTGLVDAGILLARTQQSRQRSRRP